MKKKHFYSHIVETDSIVVKLHETKMSDEEKIHLISIMESSLHHAILDAILSELSEKDKKLFLQSLSDDDHDAVWKILKDKIEGIEDKVTKVANELKKELHEEIDEVKE